MTQSSMVIYHLFENTRTNGAWPRYFFISSIRWPVRSSCLPAVWRPTSGRWCYNIGLVLGGLIQDEKEKNISFIQLRLLIENIIHIFILSNNEAHLLVYIKCDIKIKKIITGGQPYQEWFWLLPSWYRWSMGKSTQRNN